MECLGTKSVKELRDIAKECDIKGRWSMNKQQLIEAIELHNAINTDNASSETTKVEASDTEVKTSDTEDFRETVKQITDSANEIHEGLGNNMNNDKRDTRGYLQHKEIGLIIALEHEGKFYSAKIEKYLDDGKIEVTTRGGSTFVIEESAVKWVKTGQRWPKFVFEKFKEAGRNEQTA